MKGPSILVRSLSEPGTTGKYGNAWQYHSQSDRHSNIACWGILFDLISHCRLLRSHLERGAVGFGINHEMHDFKTGRKKTLDLVLCTPGTAGVGETKAMSFASLVDDYGIVLTDEERDQLAAYPEVKPVPVGSVHLALEAKACMTAHVKALPRLYAELNSSQLTIHGASDTAIAGGFAMVNLSDSFVSPGMNKFDLAVHPVVTNQHRQPKDALRAIEKIREIPRRIRPGDDGFDALGIVVVRCRNDGSPVELVESYPAPPPGIFHYDDMIRRIAQLYESKFSSL